MEGGGSGTFIIQITVPSFLISSFCELVTLVNIWNKLAIVHEKIFYCDSYDIRPIITWGSSKTYHFCYKRVKVWLICRSVSSPITLKYLPAPFFVCSPSCLSCWSLVKFKECPIKRGVKHWEWKLNGIYLTNICYFIVSHLSTSL